MRARLTKQGSITIPKTLRQQLHLVPGEELDVSVHGAHLEISPVAAGHQPPRKSIRDMRGALKPSLRGVTLDDMREAIQAEAAKR
jgi:AbrB family looped-hinge helix DNA binding protein